MQRAPLRIVQSLRVPSHQPGHIIPTVSMQTPIHVRKLAITTRRPLAATTLYPQQHLTRPLSRLLSAAKPQPQYTHKQHQVHHHHRSIHTSLNMKSSSSSSATTAKIDWSPARYLKFSSERTRAVRDLVSQIQPLLSNSSKQPNQPRIYDLGCGPGNSTRILATTFPGAIITGVDTSASMLAQARVEFADQEAHHHRQGGVDFIQADISTFTIPLPIPPKNPDPDQEPEQDEDQPPTTLIFSNAAFHWLRTPTRLPTATRLFTSLPKKSVLALQVPDNYTQPTHTLMRTTALLPSRAWSASFVTARIGDVTCAQRPDLDPIEPVAQWYEALAPHATSVDMWRTSYQHVLADVGAIVEWVKGTGLQPYLARIEGEEAKAAFLDEYQTRLQGAYPQMSDGKVLLTYPRLFVVAVRK
ncbi:hypothetical protein EJ02DRAFT_458741 [Clathrospora elynae]|uniref:Methyltransferase domain-containing protein n=1 Tax=Clathrospora elynae TaxID=706981 RepID=A0A6A5SJ87_9PLEO|nr:hypothetical protein EJ02DRAFT_458741 [Clathrospora elynae]